MALYATRILPHLIHLTMRQEVLVAYRRRLVASAAGRVLEIGVGSGLNLPLYPPGVTHVVGVDPSLPLLSMTHHARRGVHPQFDLVRASADAIPIDDHRIDTVVTSWTMCSVPDIERALAEVRRVLRADGRLLFVEHGRAPDPRVARWQDRLTPVWKRIAGGCHLNRPIDRLIAEAGFRIDNLQAAYMSGPRVMTFMYEGRARPA